MDIKDASPAVPPPDTAPAPKEQPLVELRFKPWVFVFVIIVILWTTWFSIFGAIIPYLTTGDFAEIWPAHEYDVFSKEVLFVLSWGWLLCSPILILGFRTGVISFYETYVELRPYLWFFKKSTILYDAMHVIERGNRGMMLTNGKVPEWRESQFKYWKVMFLEGISVSTNSMGYSNPECLSQAIQIIHDRAVNKIKSK